MAKEANLSMGAVQHFYPTRDKLMAALIDGLMIFTAPGTRHFTSRPALGKAVKASVKKLLTTAE